MPKFIDNKFKILLENKKTIFYTVDNSINYQVLMVLKRFLKQE